MNKRFSKETLESRIWKDIDQICNDYGLDWEKGSIQTLAASQDIVAAYWEMQGLLRVIEMIDSKDY
jgi:hypothetical protein